MHIRLRHVSDFLVKVFENSSIHGFPYIGRRDLHLIERLFWLAILSFSFVCAYHAFSGQLERYEDNPTVLSIDTISFSEFSKPSFTMCTTSSFDEAKRSELISRIFGIDKSAPNYKTYVDFMDTVASTNYSNMVRLRPFENLPNVSKVNFLEIASEMHSNVKKLPTFELVMTELNMCQSSTEFFRYQSPESVLSSKASSDMTVEEVENCTSFEVCRVTLTTSTNQSEPNAISHIYVNSHHEVMSGDDASFELKAGSIQERTIKIDEIIADPNIRKFKPSSRKCKFPDEYDPKRDFYDVYTVNLCKMSCRIRRALRQCHCIPFFYTVKADVDRPYCDIKGLVCLSKNLRWFSAPCNCMSLCESTILTKMSTRDQNLQFDSMLTVDLVFPKTRIQRSVLFDFDDLLVGLGGSLALFLGLSFLSVVEVVYYIIECCMDALINCIKS